MGEQSQQTSSALARSPKGLQSSSAWRTIEAEFLKSGQAAPAQARLTQSIDELAVTAYRTVIEPLFPESMAMLAAGSYALGHTFPYSELDIVLLLDSERRSDALKEMLPEMVRVLWNAGLRVNSAVLTVSECVEAVERGGVSGLSLLDRRLLTGDRAVLATLEEKLPSTLAVQGGKMAQHLCELAQTRHARYGDTPAHAEPDVKEGPGGLQDLRLIHWLGMLKADHEEGAGALEQAAAYVASARCYLHYRAGCDHNVLDFEAQEGVAQQPFAAGKTSTEWMAAYFGHARTVFNAARHMMEGPEKSRSSLLDNFRDYRARLSNQEFTVSRDRLLLRNGGQLASDPELVFRLIEFVGRHGVAPAAETERKLEAAGDAFAAYCVRQPQIWTALRAILTSPHAGMALRTLEATGLMRALIPGWSTIEYLVSKDSEYRYTVGEHVLRTIEQTIELGSAAGAERERFAALYSELDDTAVLLAALLFHEMGHGGGDPAALAAERARDALVRLQMPDAARASVEFLIRHQSDFSGAVSGRDLEDPATARLLAENAGTIERLKMLAVMAYARTVVLSAEAQLPWRLEQLWRAYTATHHELVRGLETDRIQQVPGDLPGNAEFVRGFPLRYLRVHAPAEIAAHLQLYELSRPTGVAVRMESLEGAYRLTVVARDMPSLFASFAGAISSFGLDILKAEAFSNSTGVLLDTFVFGDPKRMLQQNPSEADRLTDLIRRIALGKTDAHRLMRGRALPEAKKRAIPPQVQFDSEASPSLTLVEIEAEDRPGLLYSLATVFSSTACNIDVVLVDTKGHRAIDVFYVAHEGGKLTAELQDRLKEKLLAVC